jgi:hypothetical protein
VLWKARPGEERPQFVARADARRVDDDVVARVALRHDDSALVVDEHDDLVVEVDERHGGVGANTAFGCQAEGVAGRVHSESGLGDCRVDRRSLTCDLACEGAEDVCVDTGSDDVQPDCSLQWRSKERELVVLGREHGHLAGVWML